MDQRTSQMIAAMMGRGMADTEDLPADVIEMHDAVLHKLQTLNKGRVEAQTLALLMTVVEFMREDGPETKYKAREVAPETPVRMRAEMIGAHRDAEKERVPVVPWRFISPGTDAVAHTTDGDVEGTFDSFPSKGKYAGQVKLKVDGKIQSFDPATVEIREMATV